MNGCQKSARLYKYIQTDKQIHMHYFFFLRHTYIQAHNNYPLNHNLNTVCKGWMRICDEFMPVTKTLMCVCF